MTFLILLASVAVLEYLLSRSVPRHKTEKTENPAFRRGEGGVPETQPASLSQSLNRLEHAVEQFGRGPAPVASPRPTDREVPARQP